MEFVSAEWVHDEEFNTYQIKATGDDGSVWWLNSIDSDVPPWPQYLAEGGTVTGTGPPEPETQPTGG
jgi:hypothetical protein